MKKVPGAYSKAPPLTEKGKPMNKFSGLFWLGLAAASPCLADEAEATTPLTLEPNQVSDSCESLFKTVVNTSGTALQFSPTILNVEGKKSRASLSCKISWKPSIPANKRLKSAILRVDGKMVGSEEGDGIIRLGHKMLGTGDSPSLVTHKLEDGAFSYKMQIQNIESDNCGVDAKIITTVSLLITQKKLADGESTTGTANVSLKSIKLMPLVLDDCPVIAE